ncbi:MAG: Ankyrin [Hydrocarboniphaga sp.]|uniref:ankyrin repeat domain-containing protein n=1 Tax=Hydrocarboniphaga sp. TaxID=2033016 RepID=UPI00261DE83D|nr:ankyrin repeat domain-containing protein [Hydrocarboniphaga sp.]MDB5969811.1 Ankyrin [Hydrocarboniphaga sp.]
MRMLIYRDLDLRRVRPAFDKVRKAIEAGDFRSADVKKLSPTDYWRARLDYSNRLLLRFARSGGETVCLALEVIENHAYDKSRFLRGAAIDEARIEREPSPDPAANAAALNPQPLRWLDPVRAEFELLDKPIVFDDAQETVRRLPAPVIVVGSAGSGKTAVTLAKLREAQGRVLYVTHSAYLAQSARALYGAHGYDNPSQEAEFLSYGELVETLRVPVGRELSFADFRAWFARNRPPRGALDGIDAHALFEEFRGVLGASEQGALDLPAYLALGQRQSLLDGAMREAAFDLFQRYRRWLAEAGLFDLNLVAHEWRALAEPVYDFVVVDEVQDLTNVQLALVLACLKQPGQFLLCGDSNQIVHPNFFSWAAVRSLFWRGLGTSAAPQTLSVLQSNFRNTRSVTALANTLLKIKQARFGSVDRESNFLVRAASADEGAVRLLSLRDAAVRQLDAASRGSVQHAVVVLRDEDKAAAREHFRTPLVFSVHESKGLEYPNVILYALISGQRSAYAEVCEGVTQADLQGEELEYRRARDKSDKSLEIYKFYVNALYVAMTRAVESLVLVESDTEHPLLRLLGLKTGDAPAMAAAKASSREEWAQEARKLELQGKAEQAQAIRQAFLQSAPVPWSPWSQTSIGDQLERALDRTQPSNKPRQALMDYALWHGQQAWIERLATSAQFQAARSLAPAGRLGIPANWNHAPESLRSQQMQAWRAVASLRQRHLAPYAARNFKDVLRQCEQYGIDHHTPVGATPLMLAAHAGNVALVEALLERGADPQATDEYGHTPWWFALNRAIDDADFLGQAIAPLFERIAPQALDVQSSGRLVRLERHQGEYWVLSLMLAGLKTLCTRCVERPHRIYKYEQGFFADFMHGVLEQLPQHLWKPERRKRVYLNQVLARAEVQSPYQPARRLWLRTVNGHYLPNPDLQLRGSGGADAPAWRPVYEVLNLRWVDAGTHRAEAGFGSADLATLIESAGRRLAPGSGDVLF